MSSEIVIRGLVSCVIAGTLAWHIYQMDEQDLDPLPPKQGQVRYGSVIPVLLLTALPFLALLILLSDDQASIPHNLLSMCFPIFFSICIYYIILLPALPLLRRRISARTCALLWLLPNYLYYTALSFMELRLPRWVISLPVPAAAMVAVWAAGFCAVLGWKIVGHLRFRRSLLKDARPVEDPDYLALWRRELENAGYQKIDRTLVISPAAATPLSIGLFLRTTRVVLPERAYTPEELALVLRHEIIHIGRRDSGTKFFLVFCTAVCWFNPLMWMAMERSAQDLELSCDETVVMGIGEEKRRRYAELLLTTAGDTRGFTTCLSASAQTLRYRLRNVIHPAKRSGGALLAGAAALVLTMTCGYTALAYGHTTGAEAFFPSGRMEDYTFCVARWATPDKTYTCACEDPDALTAGLEGLELEYLTDNYTFSDLSPLFGVSYDGPDGTFWVAFHEQTVRVAFQDGYRLRWESTYYLPQASDLDALMDLIAIPDI